MTGRDFGEGANDVPVPIDKMGWFSKWYLNWLNNNREKGVAKEKEKFIDEVFNVQVEILGDTPERKEIGRDTFREGVDG